MVYDCPMASQLGLRERKKQQMRRVIADTAAALLAAHARILAASPALQARQREIFHRHEQALAREIAAAAGATADQLEPRVIAAAILGAIRALQERDLAQLASGHFHPSPATLRDDLNLAFDLLANGFAGRDTAGDHPTNPPGNQPESQCRTQATSMIT